MLSVNTEILIHGNFRKGALGGPQLWKIFPSCYIPLGMIMETRRIPTGAFCEGRNKLFTEFLIKIESTEFIEKIREDLLFAAVPLFVLCIVREDAATAVANLFQYDDDRAKYTAQQFTALYQAELLEALEDTASRMALLTDIYSFWSLFIGEMDFFAQTGVGIFRSLLEPLPPHLPRHLIGKLGICSLYSNHEELVSELQGLHFPPLRLLTEHRRISIPTEVFSELVRGVFLKTVPQGAEGRGELGFLTDFRFALWDMHIRIPPKLHGQSKIPTIRVEYTQQEILSQVLCFMLPNWAQVWVEMGWPFTHEVQRRLRFLKQEQWRPRCRDFIALIVNGTTVPA